MLLMLAALGTLALAAGEGDSLPTPREENWLVVSPGGDLESKIREGLAKKVDPARILGAIRARLDSFRALGDSLDAELREAGKGAVVGDARYRLVLEMQRAMDLGLPRAAVLEILRQSVRAVGGDRADEELLVAAARFAGVAGGSGMPADQVVRVVRLGLARGYRGQEFRLSLRCILDLRERLGGRYSRLSVGRWMEEGIGRFPTCREMLESIRARSDAEILPVPPAPGPNSAAPPNPPRPD